MFTRAICRRPGADAGLGITTAGLGAPDPVLLLRQHAAYVDALRALGLDVDVLDALPGLPDAHFVEDAAVVTDDVAIVTRPGAAARRGEEQAMAPALPRDRPLARIEPPATLDGGDVLVMGRHVLVGVSERTNADGAAQLGRILAPFGVTTVPVEVGAGLHLKSGVNAVGRDVLLVTGELALREELAAYRRVDVPPEEAYAANTLWINGTLLHPAGFPTTRRRLEALGLPVLELEMSEARRMDGGLTCWSIRYQAARVAAAPGAAPNPR